MASKASNVQGSLDLVKLARDLTRPGPPKGSVSDGKSRYFREIRESGATEATAKLDRRCTLLYALPWPFLFSHLLKCVHVLRVSHMRLLMSIQQSSTQLLISFAFFCCCDGVFFSALALRPKKNNTCVATSGFWWLSDTQLHVDFEGTYVAHDWVPDPRYIPAMNGWE